MMDAKFSPLSNTLPQAAIRSSLENNAGKVVKRVGEGVPRLWQLI